jgi:hypothetical protein
MYAAIAANDLSQVQSLIANGVQQQTETQATEATAQTDATTTTTTDPTTTTDTSQMVDPPEDDITIIQ